MRPLKRGLVGTRTDRMILLHSHSANEVRESRFVRRGLTLFLFLLLYDGALRKWGLPGSEQILFILKDIAIFILLVYVVSRNQLHRNYQFHSGVSVLIMLYATWALLQTANANLPNIAVALWGLKSHLLYASLIFLIPVAFRSLVELKLYLEYYYPFIVIPICALGIFQIASPADSTINLSIAGDTEATAYFGDAGLVRITGTFSYLSGMAAFVQAMCVVGMALYIGGSRSKWFLFGWALALASLPSTGSRGVLVVVIASMFLMILIAMVLRLTTIAALAGVVVTAAALLAISLVFQDDVWAASMQRAFGDAGDEARTLTAFTNAFSHFDVAGFTGFGTGAANLGAPALVSNLRPFSWLPVGNQFEEESGRIVLELGIVGWIFSSAFRTALLVWVIWLLRPYASESGRWAVALAFPTIAYSFWVGNGVFAPPLTNAVFWFCVSLLGMAHYEIFHEPSGADTDFSLHS